ncbi:MAG: septal ring lytic transglycosylase RlpA family protein [Thermodesulfobacteriota bacterium]|jgi:rare lipoprotein A
MIRKNSFSVIALVVFMWVFVPLVGTAQPTPASPGASSGPIKGICVYYNDKFQGHVLASGEKYDKEALTAAHKTLPFGTMVKVTNLGNNKSVVVRVNDRSPHGGSKAKIIEITSRAAKEIDMIKKGKMEVQIEVVESGKK